MSDDVHLIEQAIEPRSPANAAKFVAALSTLQTRQRLVRVSHDEASGQCILHGPSEEQLDAAVAWLRDQGVPVNAGAPQVAYLERLGQAADIDYTHTKQAGGAGEFARVKILFEPGAPGSGFVFESKVVGDNVPTAFIPGVEKGLAAARENGPRAGFPLIDFKATLYDGAYHDVDSSAATFESAARGAFRQLRKAGAPELLEPIVRLEVWTPNEYLGDTIGDLRSRRGRIERADHHEGAQTITALVPLAYLLGYPTNLRGLSEGRAHYTIRFSHYAPLPEPPPPEDDPPTFRPAMGMRA